VSGLFVVAAKVQQGISQRRGQNMADQVNKTKKTTPILSLDAWAVAVALLLAALVRFGIMKHISW